MNPDSLCKDFGDEADFRHGSPEWVMERETSDADTSAFSGSKRWSQEYDEWVDGVRPPHICETPDDAEAFLHGTIWWPFPTLSPRPVIACGYCGLRKRLESKDTAKANVWLFAKPEDGGHVCRRENVPLPDPNNIPDEVWFEIQEAA
jgi:hypothetical protein